MLEVTPTPNYFEVKFNYRADIVSAVRGIKGAQFNRMMKHWTVPLHKKSELYSIGNRYSIMWKKERQQEETIPELPELKQDIPLLLKPFKYQERGIAAGLMWQRFINADEPGLGKAQPLTAKIATPYGWRQMGEMQIGTEIMGADGHSYSVTGVFPQGTRPCYKILFNDGTSTECDIDHIWRVRDVNRRRRNTGWINKTTKELMDAGLQYNEGQRRMKEGRLPRLKWEIPLTKAIETPYRHFVIHPYILGALLGDGCLSGQTPCISIPDKEIETTERIEKLLPLNLKLRVNRNPDCPQYYITQTGTSKKNPFQQELEGLGLHTVGKGKFIPQQYLFAAKEQRLDLLRGLMDTDGSAIKNRITFHTCCRQLAEDVQTLVFSLGGQAILREYDRSHENKSTEFQVNIKLQECPFYMKRKASQWAVPNRNYASKYIQQITYVGEKLQQCISVSAPDHLYLTDNFIVTHNTLQAIATVVGAGCKCILVICPNTLKDNWQREFKQVANRRSMILTTEIKNSWHRYYTTGMCNVFIVNYESLKTYFVESVSKNDKNKYDSKHLLFKDTISMFDAVIIDEAHKLKETSTLQYMITQGICWGKKFVICLTGTPIVNRSKDMLALLKLTGRLTLFGGYSNFIKHYCNDAPDTLRAMQHMLFNNCMFRRFKKDVLKDLPDKTYQLVHCDITNREEYNAALRDLQAYLMKWKNNTDAQAAASLHAQALVRITVCRNISARGKIEAAREQIDEVIEAGRKIVVFVHQREIALQLLKIYPHAVTVRGDDKPEVRSNNVQAFQQQEGCNIIIVSIKAGGTGLTLTAASDALFVEFPWHAADVDQCADRLHRIGQENAVLARFLLGRNTIDEFMYNLIEAKRYISNTVTASEDGFGREVLDQLADSLFKNTTTAI